MSKYQLLRDSMQELKHEASEKGGLNPRAQMILELIADYEAMQVEVDQLEKALSVCHKQGDVAMSEQYSVVPRPKLKRDYVGRIVRTTLELKNGWGVIPAGAVATINNQSPKGSGLILKACECCGMKAIIGHVGADSFEFIEPITQQGGES